MNQSDCDWEAESMDKDYVFKLTYESGEIQLLFKAGNETKSISVELKDAHREFFQAAGRFAGSLAEFLKENWRSLLPVLTGPLGSELLEFLDIGAEVFWNGQSGSTREQATV